MSAEVVQLHKSELDQAIDFVRAYGTNDVLFIIKNPKTGLIEYIAPTNTSIYELMGWCKATADDISSGDCE